MQPRPEEDPCRRFPIRQRRGFLLPHPEPAERPGRRARQSPKRIGRSIEDRNGNGVKDLLPFVPIRDLREVVRAHDPDEFRLVKTMR